MRVFPAAGSQPRSREPPLVFALEGRGR